MYSCKAESGTRLRPRFLKTAEGVKHFVNFWDTKRNETCSFMEASDGKLRCLPSAVSAAQFSDASCAQPGLVGAGLCGESRYITTSIYPFWCRPFPFYRLGASKPPASPIVYETYDGVCVARDNRGSITMMAEEVVPVEEFVAASLSLGEGHISVPTLLGADGSRVPGCSAELMWDRTLETWCEPQSIDRGRWRCLPEGLSVWRDFVDEACTRPAALVPTGAVCGRKYVAQYPDKVWLRGAPVARHYRVEGGKCVLVRQSQLQMAYEVGAAVELQDVALSAAPGPGNRLTQRRTVAPDGSWIRTWRTSGITFDDREVGLPCRFRRTGDGRLRCVPSYSSEVLTGFADPTCMMPIRVVAVNDSSIPDPTLAVEEPRDMGCEPKPGLYKVGAKTTRRQVFVGNPSACRSRPFSAVTAFILGEEVSPSVLVEGEYVTE